MKQLRGRVVSKPFGGASKSAHEAVMLVTASEEYVLRRKDGNPFHDPELEKLIGREILCKGEIAGYTVIMSDWEVVA